jgi:hypothetical protein
MCASVVTVNVPVVVFPVILLDPPDIAPVNVPAAPVTVPVAVKFDDVVTNGDTILTAVEPVIVIVPEQFILQVFNVGIVAVVVTFNVPVVVFPVIVLDPPDIAPVNVPAAPDTVPVAVKFDDVVTNGDTILTAVDPVTVNTPVQLILQVFNVETDKLVKPVIVPPPVIVTLEDVKGPTVIQPGVPVNTFGLTSVASGI